MAGGTRRDLAADALATFTLLMSVAGTAIAMAVLIFSGPLESGLPRAIASFVVAGGLMSIVIAARSDLVPVATIVQDGPAIVAAALVAEFASRRETAVIDVFVLLAATTLVTGIVLWLLGRFHLGGLVRYMPTTVVGAFVAGTGWLLFKGGFDVMTGTGLGLDDLVDVPTWGLMKFWLPGLLIGLVAWQVGRSDRFPPYSVGLIVVLSLAGFYAVALMQGSVADVETGGWLIGPFPDSAGITLVAPEELQDANWAGVLRSLPGIASVIGLSAVALLLNLTGIGSQLGQRLDVNAELRTTGIANLVATPFGSSPGFHAMGTTMLLNRLGATRRAVPVVTGAIMVVLGIVGTSAIGYVPRLIPGALLVTVGVGLLEEWGRGLMRSVNRVEQGLSVAILLVIMWLGILPGIGVGVIAACAVFIVRYSRVDPIRTLGNGTDTRSRVDRTPSELYGLHQHGDRLRVFELQGYLFFGSVALLENRVRAEALGSDRVEALLLDFKHVTGIDPSGYALIEGLIEQLRDADILVVLSSLDSRLRTAMEASISVMGDHLAATQDEALEYCEERYLTASASRTKQPHVSEVLSPPMRAEFERVTFAVGTVVFAQGAASDGMLIVDTGQVSVFRVNGDGGRLRLRRLGELSILGEMGVITKTARTAEIVADTDVEALWLSADRYFELRNDRPELIFELHEFIMRAQTQRVVSLSDSLSRSLR